jgi:hypothetical protein
VQDNTTWRLRNVLMDNVGTNFYSATSWPITNHCEHLTVNGAEDLKAGYDVRVILTNSLLVDLDASGGYDVYTSSHVETASDPSSVFARGGDFNFR